MVHFQVF
nr:unnamed protein product [Callosobruchus chinensis]